MSLHRNFLMPKLMTRRILKDLYYSSLLKYVFIGTKNSQSVHKNYIKIVEVNLPVFSWSIISSLLMNLLLKKS